MQPVLQQNTFLIKEHVGFFKAANNYDIYDPATGQILLLCREPKLGFFTKIFRFTDSKRMTPFDVWVTLPDGTPAVRVTRGISIFLSKVSVFDEHNRYIGGFKQKLWSIGGKFEIHDAQGRPVCMLKGNWRGWEFKFLAAGDREFARVSKKWAGLGKEFFTSADNYVLQISSDVSPDNPIRELILAAVMVIDMVLKE